jgi:hypothetical protein
LNGRSLLLDANEMRTARLICVAQNRAIAAISELIKRIAMPLLVFAMVICGCAGLTMLNQGLISRSAAPLLCVDCAREETRNLEQQLDPWRDEDADEADESGRQTVIRHRLIYNAYSSDRNLTYASSLDRNDGDAPAERAWLGRCRSDA